MENKAKFTKLQIRIIRLMKKSIIDSEEKEVRDFLETLKKGEKPKDDLFLYIILEVLAKAIGDDMDTGTIYQELEKIAKVKEVKEEKTTYTDKHGKEQEAICRVFSPYLTLTGNEKDIREEGGQPIRAVGIYFTELFFKL